MSKQKTLATLLLLAACTANGDGVDEERHPIGKADIIGQCEPTDCDGPAAGGNCWCDASCLEFGDCCENVFEVCEGDLPSPQCDDGTSLNPLCDQKPVCEAGQLASIINGCFQCVDALTCAPRTTDCSDGSELSMFCDIAPLCPEGTEKTVINGCFQCVDPVTCEPPAGGCSDGSELSMFCDIAPLCPEGTEKTIINSCFQCVDPVTCEPAPV